MFSWFPGGESANIFFLHRPDFPSWARRLGETSAAAPQAGLRVLQQGGTAADACVAAAAALNVTEPCNTGLGLELGEM